MKEEHPHLKAAREKVLLEFAPQTPVRIIRAVVYEGRYGDVAEVLKGSRPIGPHKVNTDEPVFLTIHEARVEVLDAPVLEEGREILIRFSRIGVQERIQQIAERASKAESELAKERNATKGLALEVNRLAAELVRARACVNTAGTDNQTIHIGCPSGAAKKPGK